MERPAEPKKRSAAAASVAGGGLRGTGNRPRPMREVETTHELRFETGMNELDRVLGGGAVKGSLVLVGGAPGIGKSTLMLRICDNLCRIASVLYVSGEESERQIKLRAERLHVRGEGMYLLAETNLEDVLESVNELKPDVLIVDSIQTLYNGDLTTAPGSVGQVKDCTMALMQLAKGQGITVFVIGHVNKEGSIAGPKVLEHMVDCVLYFEGEQQNSCRILRAAKNRFGATNEIGVFEMEDSGLSEVPNPSEMLLRDGLRTWHLRHLRHGGCGLFWPVQALLRPIQLSMYRAGPPTASTSTGQSSLQLFWNRRTDGQFSRHYRQHHRRRFWTSPPPT
ncbi:MAG: ATPase domain-containing protein [Flavonifractor plautii]